MPSIHRGNVQIRLCDLLVHIAEKLRHTRVLCIMEASLLVVMKNSHICLSLAPLQLRLRSGVPEGWWKNRCGALGWLLVGRFVPI